MIELAAADVITQTMALAIYIQPLSNLILIDKNLILKQLHQLLTSINIENHAIFSQSFLFARFLKHVFRSLFTLVPFNGRRICLILIPQPRRVTLSAKMNTNWSFEFVRKKIRKR